MLAIGLRINPYEYRCEFWKKQRSCYSVTELFWCGIADPRALLEKRSVVP
jgi:hypothetical protein